MSVVCIIPARGGSKRIPRKNIKKFCGKPIIAYSIEAALSSGIFDEVMVSTDDEEIGIVAKNYGAKVPFMRSEKTSDDYATTADVLKEVLIQYMDVGIKYDNVGCVYATAPFVTAEKLKKGFELFLYSDCDSVVAATEFTFPPQRGFLAEGNCVKWWFPENQNVRSQDLEKIYHDAGQFYFIDSELVLSENILVGNNARMFKLSPLEEQDIDTLTDWKIAESKYKLLHRFE